MKVKTTSIFKNIGVRWRLTLLLLILTADLFGQTRLGLHVTQEELNVWRQRINQSPWNLTYTYEQQPLADWYRIKKNADSLAVQERKHRWKGPISFVIYNGVSVVEKSTSNYPNGKYRGHQVRDGAFYLLVNKANLTSQQKANLRTSIKNHLMNHAYNDSLDFKGAKYPKNGYYKDVEPIFYIAPWVNNLLYAYDYLSIVDKEEGVSTFSPAEKDTLKKWFNGAALLFVTDHEASINGLFSDRQAKSEDAEYTRNTNPWTQATSSDGTPHISHRDSAGNVGHYIAGQQEYFNNRRMSMYRTACLIGLEFGDTSYVAKARRFVKDWLKYGVFPDGVVTETERMRDPADDHEHGWTYTTDIVMPAITIADAILRSGGQNLFNWDTQYGTFGTDGTPTNRKNIRKTIDVLYKIAAKKVKWYGAVTAADAGNPQYLIDGKATNWLALHDIRVVTANLYYKDPLIKQLYKRDGPNMDPYPAFPAAHGGGWPWQGDWGTYPSILFQFRELENVVNPYPVNQYEAELATLSGAKELNIYGGYTGLGYADYQNASNDYIEWSVNVPAQGSYVLKFKYAVPDSRNLQILVNGNIVQSSLAFPSTGSLSTWIYLPLTVNLNAGINTIRALANGTSGPNIDHLVVESASQTLEAELATLVGVRELNIYGGYTGTGYGDYQNASNDYIEWTANVVQPGTYSLKFKYAVPDPRSLQISLNGNVIQSSLSFASTGSLSTWVYLTINANLTAGANKIRATAIGSSGPNIDHLIVEKVSNGSARLSAPEITEASEFNLFPNPVKDKLTITLKEKAEGLYTIQVVDNLGKIQYSKKHEANADNQIEVSLAGSSIRSGIYFLKVGSNKVNGNIIRIIKE
jgi:hypothetical protein